MLQPLLTGDRPHPPGLAISPRSPSPSPQQPALPSDATVEPGNTRPPASDRILTPAAGALAQLRESLMEWILARDGRITAPDARP